MEKYNRFILYHNPMFGNTSLRCYENESSKEGIVIDLPSQTQCKTKLPYEYMKEGFENAIPLSREQAVVYILTGVVIGK